MAKPKKRSIRLIAAPWLSHRRRMQKHKGDLRLVRKRRLRGFILVGLLLVFVGLYLYLTNPSNLRRWTENYLRTLVNGRVEVAHASFSFIDGIRLRDIRICNTQWKQPDDPVFTAQNVDLKVSWSALLSGRLAARKITAYRPEVFLVEDSLGNWNYQTLFVRGDFKVIYPLPAVVLRQGRINYSEDIGGEKFDVASFDLEAQLEPAGPEERDYKATVETTLDGQTVASVQGNFNAVSGAFTELAGQISLTEAVRQSLPRRVRNWMSEYGIVGQLSVSGQFAPGAGTLLTAQLQGVSLQVPLPDGEVISVDMGRGELQFSETQILFGSIDPAQPGRTEPVQFWSLDGMWEVSGFIDGYDQDSDFDVTVSCSDFPLPSDPKLIKSLPVVLRDIYDDWEPVGRIGIEIHLERTGGPDTEIIADGYVRCLNVAGAFRHFPYRAEEITGLIRFNQQKVILEQLRARHYSASDPSYVVELAASGEVLPPYEDCYATIVATGRNVVADEELRSSLKEEDRRNWDLFEPTGKADVSCRLVHKPGMGDDWLSDIECSLKGAGFTYKEFPYPLTDLHGRVFIGPETIEVGRPDAKDPTDPTADADDESFLIGRAGAGIVGLRGNIVNLGQSDETVTLDVSGHGIALDETLARALPAEARQLFDTLNPSGTAQVSGVITSSKDRDPELDFLLDLRPTNASCQHKNFPYPLDNVQGLIKLSPKRFEVLEFTARQGKARFTGSGYVATEDSQQFDADLRIVGQDVALDDLVRQSLPPDQQEIWDELQPQGTCNVELKIFHDPNGLLSHRATLTPVKAGITYKLLPYPLKLLSGQVVIAPELIEMAVKNADPDVSITGLVAGPPGAPNADMKIVAKDVPLDEQLKEILPEGMQSTWEPLNPEGKVDIYIDSLNYSLSESGEKIWDLRGAGLLKNVNLANPFPCRGLSANITGALQISDQGTQILCQGPLAIPELQVGPLRITDVTGLFSKESAMDPRWSVKNIKGKLAGGSVLAQINGKFETDGLFTATIEAEDVDLATLMNEFAAAQKEEDKTSDPEEAQAQGKLKASVKLEGKLNSADAPTGRGKVLIEEAQLYRLPLIMQIMRVLSLQPIHTNAFDTASFDFYLEGQKIIFTEIALSGPALRMVGTGVYDRSDDSIHAVLVRDPPKDIWRILPALSEIVVAEISGTMGEPKVQDKPFRDISEELKKLFQPRKPR